MESQYNFQMKSRNDRREWEEIKVFCQTYCDRAIAIRYAKELSKKFNSEIRMTEGANPFKTSGTYIYEK